MDTVFEPEPREEVVEREEGVASGVKTRGLGA